MKSAAELQKENDNLREQLAAEKAKTSERDQKISALTEHIRHLLSKCFGSSSEKTTVEQFGLFNEAEELVIEEETGETEKNIAVAGHERKKKPRNTIPDHLPREEIVYDLPEDEKFSSSRWNAAQGFR